MPSVISFKKTPANAAPAAQAPAPAPAAAPTQVVNAVPATAKPATAVTEAAPAPATVGEVAPAPTTAIAPVPAAGDGADLVTADFYNGVGQFHGEFDAGDLRIPYLSICGPSSATFKDNPTLLGQFIYNKQLALGNVIRAVFIRAEKFYVEDLPYDPASTVIAKRWNRAEDYRAAGYRDDQVKDAANLDLCIELPADTEGIEEVTDVFVGDKAYIPARYSVQSTSYGKTVPVLRSDVRGFLKGNLVNGFYTLTATKHPTSKNLYFYPVLKTDGPTDLELRRALVSRFGA